jgi:hypothetical protein
LFQVGLLSRAGPFRLNFTVSPDILGRAVVEYWWIGEDVYLKPEVVAQNQMYVTSESDLDPGTTRIAQIASEPTDPEYYKLLSLIIYWTRYKRKVKLLQYQVRADLQLYHLPILTRF